MVIVHEKILFHVLLHLQIVTFTSGKLSLTYFPKQTEVKAIWRYGRTLIYCEVDSDRPFKLKWYRNGIEITKEMVPPFEYVFADGTGKTYVQWPYFMNRSRGLYECRATNGFDPPVSHKVNFVPVKKSKLPPGFPTKLKNLPKFEPDDKIYFGTNITLHCDATGAGNIDLHWFFHYVPLDKKYVLANEKEEGFDYWLSGDKKIMKIYNLGKVYDAPIHCFAVNDIGMIQVAEYKLDTYPRPIIKVPPKILSSPQNVSVGGPEQWVKFICNATGSPAPTYDWWHDDRWIAKEHDTPVVSLTAMRTGFVRCHAKNIAGEDTAVAYLTVTPLPYRANSIKEITSRRSKHSFTFEMSTYFRESDWHKDIPITYAIIDYRPWHPDIEHSESYKQRRINLNSDKVHGPWIYTWGKLEPWTYLHLRVQFGNMYGIGNVSKWVRCNSDWAEIEDPVRNLISIPHSNQSFTLKWDDPYKTNGPIKKYELHWTTDPHGKWENVAVSKLEKSFKYSWTGSSVRTGHSSGLGVAPVVYWKVDIYGFINKGPTSPLQVFRVSPGAPGGVTDVMVKPINSTSLRVTWVPTNNTGNGIIGHRIIFTRKDEVKDRKDWNFIEIAKESVNEVILNNLLPNKEYDVIVYPRSHEIIGIPSNVVSVFTNQDAPSQPPQHVRGIAKSSETVQVIWEAPAADHQNAPIIYYDIYYTKVNRKPNKKRAPGDVRTFLLQGLGKYTKYTIWVVAVNVKGGSPASSSFEILTEEEVPKGAPRSVRGYAINDTSIALTWLPPDNKFVNKRIIGYKIYCREIYRGKVDHFEHKMEVIGNNVRDAIFQVYIAEERIYQFQIVAFTNEKEGTRSNPVVVETPKKLPPSPLVKLELDLTSNYVTMKWWPRTENIEQYKITYAKTLRKYDMLTSRKEKLVQPHIRMSAFNDLSAGVYYCFKISGEIQNDQGWTAQDVQWIKTADWIPSGEPLYLQAVTESASTIRVQFDEPDPWKQNGKIIGYKIGYKSMKDFDWLYFDYRLKSEEDSVVHILEDLHPNTRYKIKVCAYTAVGSGAYSQEIELTTSREVLPTVTNLKAVESETTSAYIQWKEPSNLKNFLDQSMKYLLNYVTNKEYRDEKGNLQRLSINKTIPVLSTHYNLEDLIPGTTYKLKVFVELEEAGVGDPVHATFKTDVEAPKGIKSPVVNTSIEMPGYIPIMLYAASEEFGTVNHYLLFVINLKESPILPPSLKSENFGTNNLKRERRNTNNSTVFGAPPEYYIAAFLKRNEVPVLYKLGEGDAKDGYRNHQLNPGYHYSTFLRAYIRKGDDKYLITDSPFSAPIKYSPNVKSEIDYEAANTGNSVASNNSAIIIIAVGISVVLLLMVILLAMFIYWRRDGKSGERDRLLSRSSKKFDPAEVLRQNSTAPGMASHPPIPSHALAKHVDQLKANGGEQYLLEFESIDPGIKRSAEASNLTQNQSKNRYGNVVAFDDTRVKLEIDDILCADYINANYIDGYCQEKAYIATQGPLKNTIDDFWRLCWEQNVHTIVMMTKCEERGRNRCEEYWPSKGSEVHANIKVAFKSERMLCNYCIRTFLVSSTINGDERTIKHFQYLKWPDPGVPENPGPVLSFVRRVKYYQQPGSGPTLVHCSAGIGRSACFIAIDAMLERLKHDSMVDIYGYITLMRSQRNFMVQTDEQYIFVYDAIVEAIDCGNTEIKAREFASEFKRLSELNTNENETGIERQFKSIALNNQYSEDMNLITLAHSTNNEKKNRCRTIVPFDKNRVVLQALRSHEGSDYINASFINGYSKENAFIATQGPLEHTVADFWRMLMEQDCGIIVMLTNLEEKGKELCSQYWPSTKTMNQHYYLIDPVQENRFANFVVRDFKVTDPRIGKSRYIRQYHYLNWPNGRVPENTEGVIELIGHVQKAFEKMENKGPLVIHSSIGNGRTGVYIALSIALECLRKDYYMDLRQIVKQLRYERPYMVQTREQYEYCYKVISYYLKPFDHLE